MAKLCQTLVIPWTVDCQAPLSMGFPRQEYWSGLPFPSPGDLPKSGVKSESSLSPALEDKFFTTDSPENPLPWVTEAIDHRNNDYWASQVALVVKNPPANAD